MIPFVEAVFCNDSLHFSFFFAYHPLHEAANAGIKMKKGQKNVTINGSLQNGKSALQRGGGEFKKVKKKLSFRRDCKGNWFLKKKASQFEKFIWV